MMLYSSGTTGRPKGIKPPLSGRPCRASGMLIADSSAECSGWVTDTPILLAGAPLPRGAVGLATSIQRLGGTIVLMEQFDPAKRSSS